MANLKLTKLANSEWSFIIDNNVAGEIRNVRNDLFTYGTQCHFKTANGANIIQLQQIVPTDVTIVATATTNPQTVTELFDTLFAEGYFDWIKGGGTGTGVDRFDALLDTFKYTGRAGQVVIVDGSELKLTSVIFSNVSKFTDLSDTPISIVPDQMVVSNSDGNALIFKELPKEPETFLNSVGYFLYDDAVTQTTPIPFTSNTEVKITNDTLGLGTDYTQSPFGVSSVWNSATNQTDFSDLSIGDVLTLRMQLKVNTNSTDQRYEVRLKLAAGTPNEEVITIFSKIPKIAGLDTETFAIPFPINNTSIKDSPSEIWLFSDGSGTIKVGVFYFEILRKNINLVQIGAQGLDAKADKIDGATQITDPNPYANIGTLAGATQAEINSAINAIINIGTGLPAGGTATDYLNGDGSWKPLLSMPISTATQTALNAKADKTDGATQITDPTAYPTIGSAANATQAEINALIETKIGIGGTGTYVAQDLDTEYFSAAGGNKTFIVIQDIVDVLGVFRNGQQLIPSQFVFTAPRTITIESVIDTDEIGISYKFTAAGQSADVSLKADKIDGATQITDPTAYPTIGSAAGATQAEINALIETKIGTGVVPDVDKAYVDAQDAATLSAANTYTDNKVATIDLSAKADKTGGVGQITDTVDHANIGSVAGNTQASINNAIDAKLGAIVIPDVNKTYVDTQDSNTLSSAKIYTDTELLTKADKIDGASQITDTNNYANIGSVAGDTQAIINNAINSKLGAIVVPNVDKAYVDAADALLQTNIDDETTARTAADADLQSQVTNALNQALVYIGIISNTNAEVTADPTLLDAFVLANTNPSRARLNNDKIVDSDDHAWIFSSASNLWIDTGIDRVSLATTTQAGIVKIAIDVTIGETGVVTGDLASSAISAATINKADKTNGTTQITDPTAYTSIGSAAGDTQAQINAKINTKIGAVVVPDVNKAYVDTQDAATLVSAKTYTDNSVSSKADKTNGATQITDPTAYPTIGSAAGATQAQINALIEVNSIKYDAAIDSTSLVANNQTGAVLTAGTIVQIDHVDPITFIANVTKADQSTVAIKSLFIVGENIPNATTGLVHKTKRVDNVNTTAFANGQILYLAANGQYSATRGAINSITVGIVIKSATVGTIQFSMDAQQIQLKDTYLDEVAIKRGWMRDFDMTNHKIAGVKAAVNPDEAVNKSQLDAAVVGTVNPYKILGKYDASTGLVIEGQGVGANPIVSAANQSWIYEVAVSGTNAFINGVQLSVTDRIKSVNGGAYAKDLSSTPHTDVITEDTAFTNLSTPSGSSQQQVNTAVDALFPTKANKTDLDTTNASVALKANQTDLNTTNTNLTTTNTNLAGLTTTVGTKASQTDLNALTTTVNTKQDKLSTGLATEYRKGDNTIGVFTTDVDARITAQKGVNSGVAPLDTTGKIPAAYITATAITDTFTAISQAAMLALAATKGDVCVRTDINKSFILQTEPATTLANWQELLTPLGTIQSVFGRATTNIVATAGDYNTSQITESAGFKFQSDNQDLFNDATSSIQTQLNSKAADAGVLHKATDENITGTKTIVNKHLMIASDGMGVGFNGGAYIYKKTGTGIVVRLHTANTRMQAENNAGAILGTYAYTSELTPKANDANVLHLTGDETYRGVKRHYNDANVLTTDNVTAVAYQRADRFGQGGNKWGAASEWRIGSYANTINSQTKLELWMANGATNVVDTKVLTIDANSNVSTLFGSIPVSWQQFIGASANGILRDAGANFGKVYEYTLRSPNGSGNLTAKKLMMQTGDTNTGFFTTYSTHILGNPTFDAANNRTTWRVLVKRLDGTFTDGGWGSTTVYINASAN